MDFSIKEQFEGFLATPQIYAEDHILDYPLYHAFHLASPEELPEISAPGATILGKRMEHFFGSYIDQFTSEMILAHNRQIIQDQKTLGELDFLLKNSISGEISHVELIYKFYIYDEATGSSESDHLIGPNKRDSLGRKIDRLKKRQFPLLYHEATRNLLDEWEVAPNDVVQKMCFKASVFLPKRMDRIPLEIINPATISGYWIKTSEFTLEAYQKNKFFIPAKNYWPVKPERNSTWLTRQEIEPQLHQLLAKKFSPLVWMKTPSGKHERFFVVWW